MNILPENLNLDDFMGIQESQHVRPSTDYVAELKERLKHGYQIRGEKLPWHKTHDHVRLRDSELSIWAGINGHRKSMLLGQVMLFLPPTEKILIASLEMGPVDTLERMSYQALGGGTPTDKFVDQFAKLTENIFIYDQQDSIPSERIIAMCSYMSQVEGFNHIVLDSLMKCVSSSDDWNAQKQFIDRLTWVCKRNKVHIHVVHHTRKGRSENDALDKFDVKGAGEITDLCDNLFLVQTNKEKKAKLDRGEDVGDMEPDQTLTVAKQRHGKWEGTINLWFKDDALQFVGGPDSRALPWRVETRFPQASNF